MSMPHTVASWYWPKTNGSSRWPPLKFDTGPKLGEGWLMSRNRIRGLVSGHDGKAKGLDLEGCEGYENKGLYTLKLLEGSDPYHS